MLVGLIAVAPSWAQGGQPIDGRPTPASKANAASAPVTARPALSDADRTAARTLADGAFDALDAGRYAQAEQLFSQALERADVPTLRVGRGEALLKLNRWVEAQADFQLAVKFQLLPTDPPAFRESQETAIADLKLLAARMPRLAVTSSDPQTTASIDGGVSQSVQGSDGLPMDPGNHRVVITAWGLSETHEVEAIEGKRTELVATQHDTPPNNAGARESTALGTAEPNKATAAPTTATQSNVPEDSAVVLSDRVVIAGAVTGALAIGAVVTGIVFWNARGDSLDSSLPISERNEHFSTAQTTRWVSTALTAAAVVGAGLTTYFWLSPASMPVQEASLDKPRNGQAWTLPFADGIVLGVGGRF